MEKIPTFTKDDFEVFHIDGLAPRMEAIRERIQPKFRVIGEMLVDDLTVMTGDEMFLHIAKHARRTVNPPKDTWLAIAANKRGYKKHPHFQVGLFDDRIFIWLAYIYELPRKKEIAQKFLQQIAIINNTVPSHYVISMDHMQKEATSMQEIDLEKTLTRFRDIKKAEFLIGRHIFPNDPVLQDGKRFLQEIQETFSTLLPLYQLSVS